MCHELLNRYEELNLLYSMSHHLAGAFNVRQVCENLIQEVRNVVSPGWASLVLYDDEEEKGAVMATLGFSQEQPSGWQDLNVFELSARVIRTGEEINVNDLDQAPAIKALLDSEFAGVEFHATSLVGIPLRAGERVVGCLLLLNSVEDGSFSSEDQKFAQAITSLAAISPPSGG